MYVLRLSHRRERDKRVTTHVLLTARAFGARGAFYSGDEDPDMEEKIRDVVARWGGAFEVRYEPDWLAFMKRWKASGGFICHLTMYGLHIDDCMNEVPRDKPVLVVVGSEKVPRVVYEVADLNMAIGHQPHSEVAALAVFLDRFFGGEELRREFEGAKLKIMPSRKGKRVLKLRGR
ncbi:MAG TPA: tRNA (cytidine(56)-2'-O)-methyltransferase [Candidatus Bathyarchaeota archaeon]|nr:tRNA (cytidine(56)-2'-O)-methyltransferase [Candidatus Bathyarchaeota archaeon]